MKTGFKKLDELNRSNIKNLDNGSATAAVEHTRHHPAKEFDYVDHGFCVG